MVEILNISEEKNKKKVARDLLFTSAPISIHLFLTGIHPPMGPILGIKKNLHKEYTSRPATNCTLLQCTWYLSLCQVVLVGEVLAPRGTPTAFLLAPPV